MSYEELLKCDGRKFKAEIKGVECEGVITVQNGDVYLCQNERNGAACTDKKGYKYSWGYMDKYGWTDSSVQYFSLLEPTYPKVMLVSYLNNGKGVHRVVFMEKNGKYLAWEDAETMEEAERTTEVVSWDYAKDIEEPSPFEKELEELNKKVAELSERIKNGER